MLAEAIFENGELGLSKCRTICTEDPYYIETFEMLADGSIILRVFSYENIY